MICDPIRDPVRDPICDPIRSDLVLSGLIKSDPDFVGAVNSKSF